MCDSNHVPTVVGEGKAYLNGKECDLSEFYASPFVEAADSENVAPVVAVAERKLMPGEYISGEVREAFIQAVSKAQPEEA